MAISWDTGTKLGVIALSNLWGIWEGRLSFLNRKRAEAQQGQVSDQGSLAWIFVAVFVGILIACFYAFSGKGALSPLDAWVALAARFLNVPNPRISIRSPRCRDCSMHAKIASTTNSAWCRAILFF